MMKIAHINPSFIKVPVQMLLGGKDQLISNKAAIDYFNGLGTNDRDLLVHEDLDHLIIHDKRYQ